MYIVFIASSIPTLRPFFRRYFSNTKASHSPYHSDRHPTHLAGEDGTALTTYPVPPGRANAYIVADDDGTRDNWMGNGHILRTTKIDISRNSSSEGS